MRAALITAPGHVTVEEVPEPVPAHDEVKVAVDLVGICATDVHMLHGSFPAARYPVRPGHEATGRVVQIGGGAEGLQIGDRVVLDPGVPCGRCALCRDGRPNLCEGRHAFGIDLPGAAAEFITAPASNWYRLADGAATGAAVLGEPLACVVHALDLIPAPQGDDVLIYGSGTVGLLAVSVLRTLGVRSVTVVDRVAGRLELARSAGATYIAESPDAAPFEAWNLVIDATGAPAAIRDGLSRLRRGGTFLQIGVAPPEATVPLVPYTVFQRELTIQGSMTTRHSFPRAISLIEAGAIDPRLFSAAPYSLDEYVEAIARSGSGDVPKVVIAPNA